MLIPGERHPRKVLAGYAAHYNGHRPHQGMEQEPALHRPGQIVDIAARTGRRQIPGGLTSEYNSAA